mmetsp:Transcript_14973/g.44080  ORF Transcript_14973/g.44080 Transcript_14973/m.44080 type:complete len:434 (-) Transcript_14973:1838-3139(-)
MKWCQSLHTWRMSRPNSHAQCTNDARRTPELHLARRRQATSASLGKRQLRGSAGCAAVPRPYLRPRTCAPAPAHGPAPLHRARTPRVPELHVAAAQAHARLGVQLLHQVHAVRVQDRVAALVQAGLRAEVADDGADAVAQARHLKAARQAAEQQQRVDRPARMVHEAAGGLGAAERPRDEVVPKLLVALAAHKVNRLRDVPQLLDDDVQSLAAVAHAAEDVDLLRDEAALLTDCERALQGVVLTGRQELHELAGSKIRRQLHLQLVVLNGSRRVSGKHARKVAVQPFPPHLGGSGAATPFCVPHGSLDGRHHRARRQLVRRTRQQLQRSFLVYVQQRGRARARQLCYERVLLHKVKHVGCTQLQQHRKAQLRPTLAHVQQAQQPPHVLVVAARPCHARGHCILQRCHTVQTVGPRADQAKQRAMVTLVHQQAA